jgi:uncharacterized protein (TIGR00297 family)
MPTPPRFSEDGRRVLHMLAGAGALLLPYARWWEATIALGVVVAINAYLLPKLARAHVYRSAEPGRGLTSGVVLYPAAILLLVLLFKHRPDIVAAVWGILAAGDGAAALVGRRMPSPPVPWNREKSIAGSVAFVVAGGAAGVALAWWCRPVVLPPPFFWFTIAAPIAAAIAAAAVETIPVRLDDNVTVPGASALVLFALSLINTDMAIALAWRSLGVLPLALGLNVAAAAAGFAARIVSRGGAACGALIGTTVFLTTGWSGWALLFATLVFAAVATRLGSSRKSLLGIAEERGGRRGAASAFANTSVGVAASVLSATSYAAEPALVAFVAALAAGGADTVASEIGKAWGRRTYALTPPRQVAPGTAGAVSLEGTAAGIVAALALGALAVALHLVPAAALPAVVVGAFAGSLVESLLGGTLEAPGFVNNALLNFLNTAVAAGAAVLLFASR